MACLMVACLAVGEGCQVDNRLRDCAEIRETRSPPASPEAQGKFALIHTYTVQIPLASVQGGFGLSA